MRLIGLDSYGFKFHLWEYLIKLGVESGYSADNESIINKVINKINLSLIHKPHSLYIVTFNETKKKYYDKMRACRIASNKLTFPDILYTK